MFNYFKKFHYIDLNLSRLRWWSLISCNWYITGYGTAYQRSVTKLMFQITLQACVVTMMYRAWAYRGGHGISLQTFLVSGGLGSSRQKSSNRGR